MGWASPGWNPEDDGELIRAGREGSMNDAFADSIGKTLEECIQRLTCIGPSRGPSDRGVAHCESDNQVIHEGTESFTIGRIPRGAEGGWGNRPAIGSRFDVQHLPCSESDPFCVCQDVVSAK
jgi:hypothetical protein